VETATKLCPRGGMALIGQGFLDPADHWTVSCSACGLVGVIDGERWQVDDLAARHMREGYVVDERAVIKNTLTFYETKRTDG
jgi:hypothetical protein